MECISGLFHHLVSRSMSALTLAFIGSNFGGDWTAYVIEVGSYLSPQIWTVLPFLIRQIKPSCNKPLEEKILCHSKDGRLPRLASKKVARGKYLTFRIWPAKLLGLCKSRQPCFANKARLKLLKSRNPIPPLALENPIFFRLIQWILESFSLCPHQIFCIKELISAQSPSGRRKMFIL